MIQEVVVHGVREELNKLDDLAFSKYKGFINKCFDLSNHYDMEPKVSFINNGARIYTYERGVCIYEYLTDVVDEGIYE